MDMETYLAQTSWSIVMFLCVVCLHNLFLYSYEILDEYGLQYQMPSSSLCWRMQLDWQPSQFY